MSFGEPQKKSAADLALQAPSFSPLQDATPFATPFGAADDEAANKMFELFLEARNQLRADLRGGRTLAAARNPSTGGPSERQRALARAQALRAQKWAACKMSLPKTR